MAEPPGDSASGQVSRVTRASSPRAFAGILVGMSVAVWWPAFTLGAWGELFFEQLLTVWVAATAALVVVIFQRRSLKRWPFRLVALLIPSLWLGLAFLEKSDSASPVSGLVDILGILVGIVGLPFTVWTLVRVLWPELFSELRPLTRAVIAVIVLAIALAAFSLGANQSHFLTCQDFDISGNSRPPGCVSAGD